MKKDNNGYGTIFPKKTKTPKLHKMTQKDVMMSDVTHSDIAKTPKEKRMWIQARRLAAKQSGRSRDEGMPWSYVMQLYENQKKSGHTIRDKDIEDAHKSKTVRAYKDPKKERKAKEVEDRHRDDDGPDRKKSYHRKTDKHYSQKKLDSAKKRYRG